MDEGHNEDKPISRNTKVKRNRGYAYVFTLNNYTEEDIKGLTDPEKSKNYNYIFQKEKGTNGTPHLQGYIKFHKQISFNKVKKLLPKAHIEKAKNKYASMNYCRKDKTRDGEVYKNFDIDEVIEQQYNKKTLDEQLEELHKQVLEEYERERLLIVLQCMNKYKNYIGDGRKIDMTKAEANWESRWN